MLSNVLLHFKSYQNTINYRIQVKVSCTNTSWGHGYDSRLVLSPYQLLISTSISKQMLEQSSVNKSLKKPLPGEKEKEKEWRAEKPSEGDRNGRDADRRFEEAKIKH